MIIGQFNPITQEVAFASSCVAYHFDIFFYLNFSGRRGLVFKVEPSVYLLYFSLDFNFLAMTTILLLPECASSTLQEERVRYLSPMSHGISVSSIKKVRNMLYKNIATLGWGTIENSKLTIRRPSLTPEWFTFLLYYFFDDKVITKKEVYDSGVMRRFLLNEYDIEYLLTGAKMKKYIEVSQLGDICNITKAKGDIVEYAKTYR